MDLTFQVPLQYCSLQHQTLLPSLVTSTAGSWFCFGSIPSFFLELFLHTPTNLGNSSFSVLSFAFSHCSWGSQGKNTEVVCHSLIQWTTFCQTSAPWPICLGSPHKLWLSFIELDKAVVLWSDCPVFYDFQSVCPLLEKDKRLIETSWWERLTEGETGSCSDGQGYEQYEKAKR